MGFVGTGGSGSGGGVTATNPTEDRVSRFDSDGNLVDSGLSDDGSALTFLTRALTLGASISPEVGSSQNDWAPTGIGTATVVQVKNTANGSDVTLTGLEAQGDQRLILLYYADATNANDKLILSHADSGSFAANRFIIDAEARNLTLSVRDAVWLIQSDDPHDIQAPSAFGWIVLPVHRSIRDAGLLLQGASDELDGDKVDVDTTFSNITPNTGQGTVDDTAQLGAILAGIDDSLGSSGGGGQWEPVIGPGAAVSTIEESGVITSITVDANDAASLFDGTYRALRISFVGDADGSDGSEIWLRVLRGGVEDSGANDYEYAGKGLSPGNGFAFSSDGSEKILLTGEHSSNDAHVESRAFAYEILVYGLDANENIGSVGGTDTGVMVIAQGVYHNEHTVGGAVTWLVTRGFRPSASGDLDGLRFLVADANHHWDYASIMVEGLPVPA